MRWSYFNLHGEYDFSDEKNDWFHRFGRCWINRFFQHSSWLYGIILNLLLHSQHTMPYKHNESRRHKIKKSRYKVTNWHDYNNGLRQRGDVTIWFTEEAIADWHPRPTAAVFWYRHRSCCVYSSGLSSAATPNRRLHEVAGPHHESWNHHSWLQQHYLTQVYPDQSDGTG